MVCAKARFIYNNSASLPICSARTNLPISNKQLCRCSDSALSYSLAESETLPLVTQPVDATPGGAHSVTHPLFRARRRFVDEEHFLLSVVASVSSTAGRLGSTEADLTKSSTAGGDGAFPETIMYCNIKANRQRKKTKERK